MLYANSVMKSMLNFFSVKDISGSSLKPPTRFQWVWSEGWSYSSQKGYTVYNLVCPSGYSSLGVASMNDYYTAPDKNKYCCVKDSLLTNVSLLH